MHWPVARGRNCSRHWKSARPRRLRACGRQAPPRGSPSSSPAARDLPPGACYSAFPGLPAAVPTAPGQPGTRQPQPSSGVGTPLLPALNCFWRGSTDERPRPYTPAQWLTPTSPTQTPCLGPAHMHPRCLPACLQLASSPAQAGRDLPPAAHSAPQPLARSTRALPHTHTSHSTCSWPSWLTSVSILELDGPAAGRPGADGHLGQEVGATEAQAAAAVQGQFQLVVLLEQLHQPA